MFRLDSVHRRSVSQHEGGAPEKRSRSHAHKEAGRKPSVPAARWWRQRASWWERSSLNPQERIIAHSCLSRVYSCMWLDSLPCLCRDDHLLSGVRVERAHAEHLHHHAEDPKKGVRHTQRGPALGNVPRAPGVTSAPQQPRPGVHQICLSGDNTHTRTQFSVRSVRVCLYTLYHNASPRLWLVRRWCHFLRRLGFSSMCLLHLYNVYTIINRWRCLSKDLNLT